MECGGQVGNLCRIFVIVIQLSVILNTLSLMIYLIKVIWGNLLQGDISVDS